MGVLYSEPYYLGSSLGTLSFGSSPKEDPTSWNLPAEWTHLEQLSMDAAVASANRPCGEDKGRSGTVCHHSAGLALLVTRASKY